MKKLYSLCIVLFSITFVQAQSPRAAFSISGVITDQNAGLPLAGASIYIYETKLGVLADKDGRYLIQQLSPGRYTLEISYAGFGTSTEVINLTASIEKNFALRSVVIENQGVTVTGVGGATQIRKTPIPVTIVRKDLLLKGEATNLIDALAKIPGVSQISTGPAISKPSIRGLGYNRVVVINDGVRQEGQQWGDEHGIEIDEYGVNRAEVLKGPASIMYGSDALAGVINFISVVPAPLGTIKANLFSNYQSNNKLRGFHADLGGNNNGFIWGLNASLKRAADYINKYDGRVFNSKFKEKDLAGYLGLNKQWGYSHLLVSNFDQELGLVEGDRDEFSGHFLKLINNNGNEESVVAQNDDFKSVDPFVPRQHIIHFKVTTDNSFNIGRDRLLFTLGYQRNQRQEFGNVLDPEEKELYFDLRTVNYNLQYQFAERNHWKTTIGINGMQQNNENKGIEQLIPEYDLFDIGGFAYTQKTIDQLTLSGGLRFDTRSIRSRELADKFEAFDADFSNASASAGLSYQVSDNVNLKLNMARGFRAPSIPELASNGAHEGTNRFEYGDQDLKSEKSYQVDGGIDINGEHISLTASLFYNAVKDFIYYRKLTDAAGNDSIITDGADEFFAFRFSQGNAHLYGGEINFDIHPHPLDWLHIENSFSYVRGQLTESQDGSKNLPFIPAARLINEVRGDFYKSGSTIKNVYARVELDNTFSQNNPFTGFNTETSTDGYSLLNAGLGTDIAKKGKTMFSVYLAANNLTDVAYQNHLSRLKYAPENMSTGRMGVFNMGRNYSVKVNVPLSFKVGK